jgi:hypothetical protein
VCSFLLRVSEREESIDAEIERLRAHKRSLAAARERLENYILLIMKRMGTRKLEGTCHDLAIAKLPDMVEIIDEAELPPQYLRITLPPPPAPDKVALKSAMQAGIEIPGARLISGREKLKIK